MLECHGIHYAYDNTPVLKDIDLTVDEGEIVCLLGPSGCGKTTLLRVVAGLEPGYDGDVILNGEALRDKPVSKREFGLMFQDFALFPHMTVLDNVAFGLKMMGMDKDTRREKAATMLDTVGMGKFASRDVTALSGGEKQRVALARSLAPEPHLLMLDEPLGSLDANLREQLVIELRRIIKDVGLTSIYVTHDQREAYAISDTIVIMNDGRIEQTGTPDAVYRQPRTAFVARFLNLENIISSVDQLPRELIPDDLTDTVLIHPDGISLVSEEKDGHSHLSGKILERVFQGATYKLVTETDIGELQFATPSQATTPAVGSQVKLHIEASAVIPLQK